MHRYLRNCTYTRMHRRTAPRAWAQNRGAAGAAQASRS